MNKDIITGIIRHLLTSTGGVLVTKGVITSATLDTGVGAVLTLIGLFWSIKAKNTKPVVTDVTSKDV